MYCERCLPCPQIDTPPHSLHRERCLGSYQIYGSAVKRAGQTPTVASLVASPRSFPVGFFVGLFRRSWQEFAGEELLRSPALWSSRGTAEQCTSDSRLRNTPRECQHQQRRYNAITHKLKCHIWIMFSSPNVVLRNGEYVLLLTYDMTYCVLARPGESGG